MHGPRPFKEEKRNSNYELKGRTLPPQSQKQEHASLRNSIEKSFMNLSKGTN